jgi:hypothetical protein
MGAESYVVVSEALLSNPSTATVRVKLVRNDKDLNRRAVAAEWEVTLRRNGSEWVVATVRILAMT